MFVLSPGGLFGPVGVLKRGPVRRLGVMVDRVAAEIGALSAHIGLVHPSAGPDADMARRASRTVAYT